MMTIFLQNAGKYRHPITIQKQSETKNEYGERVTVWTDFTLSRASMNPISGKQYLNSEAIKSEISHQIHLRYIPNLDPTMRVKFGDRYFQIITIINFQEMNKELQLMCKEYYVAT